MNKPHSFSGICYVLSAAILWGTTGTSQALAPVESTPQAIGALRLLVGGATLMILALAQDRRCLNSISLPLALCAGLFVALYQLAFFWGVSLTGVAVGTMVGIGSSPVFAGILDVLFMKKHPGRTWYLSTALAICGCCVLLASGGSITINPIGVLLAGSAGLSYAVYALLMKKMLVHGSAQRVAAAVFSAGALFMSPFLLVSDLSWVARPAGLIAVIHLGVLATAVSYFLFCRGLEMIEMSTAVTLSLAEPMTAGILGLVVLREQLSLSGWAGLLLILSGLAILAVPARSRRLAASKRQLKNASTE